MLAALERKRLAALVRGETVFATNRARYAFSVLAVAVAFALRIALTPLTGEGAPFVLFFGATLVTSLVAGVGPALLSLAIGVPLGAVLYVVPAGFSVAQAVIQASFYTLDGIIVIYIAVLTTRHRERLQELNRQLLRSNEEREWTLARVRETIELAPDAYFVADLNAQLTDVNQAACALLGYERDALIGMSALDILRPEDAARLNEVKAELLVPGKVSKAEWIVKRADGALVPVEVSSNILPDHRWQAFVRDIGERKRAEDALRLSEAKFSGIVSIAADAIISVDRDQRITIFNEGAQAIFGYTRDEVLGAPLERLLPERFRALHREHFAGFIEGDESARTMAERREIFGLRKNGDEFPAEASISKVRVDGAMVFAVVLRDVTYRKSVEEALRRAVAARDDVLGIVAHDLRNPLNTIMLQASLLERLQPEVERRDQKVRLAIARSAKRMNALVKDLLDVAVVEAGELKVEHEQVSAADILRETVESQAPVASEAGLELRLEIAPGVEQVRGDRNRLLQVLDNLIGNAIKFTGKGGHIDVSAVLKGNDVVFSIADTGTGIPPESLPHVFDRFWQATARERRIGAGLGLPIAKGIVEAHGGRIWVESTVGQGTTFFFTIPTVTADSSAERERRDHSHPDATAA